MFTTVIPRGARTAEDQRQLQQLRAAVHPPDASPDVAYLETTWANTEMSVVVRLFEGGDIVGHAGVLARAGLLDGEKVLIGGIGGVQTHPDLRHRGLGREVMSRAADVMRVDYEVAFGLLVCPDEAIPFYQRLGWKDFGGTLWVDQPKGRIEFTANHVMVLPVLEDAPQAGVIDLLGPPW